MEKSVELLLSSNSIPLLEGTRLVHLLSPIRTRKEADAKLQANGLLQKGLIEPARGNLSSLVVPVKEKDCQRRFSMDYELLNAIMQQDVYRF